MSGYNYCSFIGRLGGDPEIRYTPGGTAVANFSIAITEKWKKDGESQEHTEWIKCAAFDRMGEVCGDLLKKGTLVHVAGRLRTKKWQDKEGNDRYTTQCELNTMHKLSWDDDDKPKQQSQQRPAPQQQGDAFDDDIPF